MTQKHLILIDEQTQDAVLQNIKAALQNDGIQLIYKEFNPASYQKRESGEIIFDDDKFLKELNELPYFTRLDLIVCDYNLISGVINGFQIIKKIKEIATSYKKHIILYSAQLEGVITDILTRNDVDLQLENLRALVDCKIEFCKRDQGYEQEVIKYIKKNKDFDFEEELIKWFNLRKEDTFNNLFPKYKGKSFKEIANCLESNTPCSIDFKKELIEQIIAYLTKINGLK